MADVVRRKNRRLKVLIMEKNLLIWLNENDEVVGYGDKLETHKIGQLHRAFSIFIFDKENQKMLLQKRALAKYHSGGLWSNACCSHPYKDESWKNAIQRCMKNELGITPPFGERFIETPNLLDYPPCTSSDRIQLISTFHYYSNIADMIENEIDYVFLYHPNETIKNMISANPSEIEEMIWVSLDELDEIMNSDPESFTSWFSEAYKIAKRGLEIEDRWDGFENYGFCIELK